MRRVLVYKVWTGGMKRVLVYKVWTGGMQRVLVYKVWTGGKRRVFVYKLLITLVGNNRYCMGTLTRNYRINYMDHGITK